MRIDAHQHFWAVARADYGWLTPALENLYRDFLPVDYAIYQRQHAIDGTILVQAAPTVVETEYLLHLATTNALIKGVIGWVDLALPNAAAVIQDLARDPLFKGIRPMLQDLPLDNWLVTTPMDEAIFTLIEHDLIFEALVKPRHLPYLIEFLARYPRLKVTLNHAAKPNGHTDLNQYRAALQAIAQHPQIVCKLSGMVNEFVAPPSLTTLQPWFDCVLQAFGPERLMWGSDWPVVTDACTFDNWIALTQQLLAPLNQAQQQAIWGDTACRWYKI